LTSGMTKLERVATRLRLLRADDAFELLVELRNAPRAVEDLLTAARPRRMRRRVDVEGHHIARSAPGRPRQVLRPVVQEDGDVMVIGVTFFFHGRPQGLKERADIAKTPLRRKTALAPTGQAWARPQGCLI